MVELLGGSRIRALATELDVSPRKALGQNFVVDQNTIRRIVRLAEVTADDHVLEVGPGLGSLTLGLLEAADSVTAIELDPRLAQALPATARELAGDRAGALTVLSGDALRLSAADLAEPPTMLVANLPYNVAVPVLLHCLPEFPSLTRALVMVQTEVAQRLVAAPGSRIYGIPSVKLAWYGSGEFVGSVPPAVFWPVPRVDSGLVRWMRRSEPEDVSRRVVFDVVDAAFAQRRKMLRSSLRRFGSVEAALDQAGIPARARPEQLSLDDFVRLAAALALT